jgi:transcriptional regulator with XRE-family HTH domain
LLKREFEMSGITRAELAVRTGKSRALISRLLGQPSNLTVDTAAQLIFAISGKEIQYGAVRPQFFSIIADPSYRPGASPVPFVSAAPGAAISKLTTIRPRGSATAPEDVVPQSNVQIKVLEVA